MQLEGKQIRTLTYANIYEYLSIVLEGKYFPPKNVSSQAQGHIHM